MLLAEFVSDCRKKSCSTLRGGVGGGGGGGGGDGGGGGGNDIGIGWC